MKKFFIKIRTFAAVLILVLFAACEEVIDIDLNSSNTVLVAEGVIDNESPAWLKLSYTSDYFAQEQANIEKNAIVIISDNAGITETLDYTSDGLYQGTDIMGSLNKQYTLTILLDGVEYEASSTLFPPSEILSVSFEKNEIHRPGQDETNYSVRLIFKDDTSTSNHYLIKFQSSGEIQSEGGSYFLVDDNDYENTGEIEYSPFKVVFSLNDEVTIELYSIDKDTYHYYSEMNNASGGGMMVNSSTPYTPKSNFGNEVVGCFAAWSKVEHTSIVQ